MNSRELASLAIRRVFVLLFFFYYRLQGFEHLEGETHYAVVLAPNLEVDGTIVVVDERFGEEPLVVVKPLSPLWDGFVLYLACLLTHLAYAPPLSSALCMPSGTCFKHFLPLKFYRAYAGLLTYTLSVWAPVL